MAKEAGWALMDEINEWMLIRAKRMMQATREYEMLRNRVKGVGGSVVDMDGTGLGKGLVDSKVSATFGHFLQALRVIGRDVEADKYEELLKSLFLGCLTVEDLYFLSVDDISKKIAGFNRSAVVQQDVCDV